MSLLLIERIENKKNIIKNIIQFSTVKTEYNWKYNLKNSLISLSFCFKNK